MKVCLTVTLLLLGGLTGCSAARSGKTDAGHSASVSNQAGHIKFPQDSPQLTRIQSAVVEAAKVPAVEIIALGKIEANSNRVS